jgi:hypothetical protein
VSSDSVSSDSMSSDGTSERVNDWARGAEKERSSHVSRSINAGVCHDARDVLRSERAHASRCVCDGCRGGTQ